MGNKLYAIKTLASKSSLGIDCAEKMSDFSTIPELIMCKVTMAE
jgi:hypothetical protein